MGFIPERQELFNTWKKITVKKNHINTTKGGKIWLSWFDRIHHPFKIKHSVKLGLEESYLNIIKYIYEKPIANIIFNSERPKTFPLRSRICKNASFQASVQHWNIIIARAIRRKKKERNPNWKKRSKIISICKYLYCKTFTYLICMRS